MTYTVPLPDYGNATFQPVNERETADTIFHELAAHESLRPVKMMMAERTRAACLCVVLSKDYFPRSMPSNRLPQSVP